jgi:exopolyphosphatase / guanosine-5'-triphosphate,3'-diphosphate pyrophosphatase
MRKAVIDLGTNTFNLLIAEVEDGQLNLIHSDKAAVLLGMGGINRGIIAEDAMERAKDALKLFKAKCEYHNVKSVKAIGTSALRASSNSKELVDYAENILKIQIEIVTGLQEADFIYRGVKWGYNFMEPTIVMDIGGGSTEFIFADITGVKEVTSLNIGVSRIYQTLNQPDEFTDDSIKKIVQFLDDGKCDFFSKVDSKILMGSSGSFETIYEMIYKKSFPENEGAIEIPLDEVRSTLEWIITSSLQERIDNDWIVLIRKKMLPIAAVKILWVINHFKIERLIISPFSLKEGVLNE